MLSFPPHTLRAEPTLLPVIFRGSGVVALAKPAGVPVDEHPWTRGVPDICGEFRKRLAAGTVSAAALGLKRPAAVLSTDAECSGAALFADRDGGALEKWRNAAGSGQLRFFFVFLTRVSAGTPAEGDFVCRLPVAAHFTEARALVSRKTGKKAETRFSRLEKFGTVELWRAETSFPRLHQIRLHAAESGISVLGDALYGGAPAVSNAELSRKGRLNKGEERPLYAPPCLHLERISVPAGALTESGAEIVAPLPDGFAALVGKLRRSRGG